MLSDNLKPLNFLHPTTANGSSASDIYVMNITDVDGNLLVSGPDKTGIICLNYAFGVQLPMQRDIANTERTAGRPVFQDMSFTKMSDLSTPTLMAACAAATNLKTTKFHIGRTVGGEYANLLDFEMDNTIVSTFKHVGEGGGVLPYDVFTLSFTAVRVTYSQSKFDNMPGGSTEFGWDLSTNLPA